MITRRGLFGLLAAPILLPLGKVFGKKREDSEVSCAFPLPGNQDVSAFFGLRREDGEPLSMTIDWFFIREEDGWLKFGAKVRTTEASGVHIGLVGADDVDEIGNMGDWKFFDVSDKPSGVMAKMPPNTKYIPGKS